MTFFPSSPLAILIFDSFVQNRSVCPGNTAKKMGPGIFYSPIAHSPWSWEFRSTEGEKVHSPHSWVNILTKMFLDDRKVAHSLRLEYVLCGHFT